MFFVFLLWIEISRWVTHAHANPHPSLWPSLRCKLWRQLLCRCKEFQFAYWSFWFDQSQPQLQCTQHSSSVNGFVLMGLYLKGLNEVNMNSCYSKKYLETNPWIRREELFISPCTSVFIYWLLDYVSIAICIVFIFIFIFLCEINIFLSHQIHGLFSWI